MGVFGRDWGRKGQKTYESEEENRKRRKYVCRVNARRSTGSGHGGRGGEEKDFDLVPFYRTTHDVSPNVASHVISCQIDTLPCVCFNCLSTFKLQQSSHVNVDSNICSE